MKYAGIYNPYWGTLGGGEKYTASIINVLLSRHYSVSIFSDQLDLTQKIFDRFNLNIEEARINPKGYLLLSKPGNLLDKIRFEHTFDLLFWVTDGSIPFMNAKQNMLHFQVPFRQTRKDWKNALKMTKIHQIISNSAFTKEVIDQEFKCSSTVLYPPATIMNPLQKQKVILSVGRFDNLLHAKRQDVLIKSFQDLNLPDWKLVLAGGSLSASQQITELKKLIGRSKNIQLIINPSFQELSKLYGHASIYWHAAGYGSDLQSHPEKAEHFGISTVEAMSAGAIPIVFNGGGQPEIVKSGLNGYLWDTPKELEKRTLSLINNQTDFSALSYSATKTAQQFSLEKFHYAFNQLVS